MKSQIKTSLASSVPGRFADGQVRTLQRRINAWRALEGPPKEVFFPQVHRPGELCQSDFTFTGSLGITIQGQSFAHLIYHFVLTYSNWETGTICYSESFESLSEGLQNALWELGGVPEKHRTERLTAAVQKTDNPEAFTQRYGALLAHYRLQGHNGSSAFFTTCTYLLRLRACATPRVVIPILRAHSGHGDAHFFYEILASSGLPDDIAPLRLPAIFLLEHAFNDLLDSSGHFAAW